MPAILPLKPASLPSGSELSLMRNFATLLEKKNGSRKTPMTLVIGSEHLTLPDSLKPVLGACLSIMTEGQAVVVMPVVDEVGTQEAADLLGVSRPHLVKLLDAKAIPSRKVGVQRRVKVEDVLAYQKREKAARRRVLTELAAEDQRLGLGQ
jgi:excisionase family DNA binding protein